ncbi:MAG TPA: hypothetical protein VHF69_09280, partial [Candidatus Synoicihabitans sp.]|nr:hypothetical protein [Candidatus Synoicihabitans sp.]
MTTFAATFFDGKFARGQTATVQIVDDGTWEITTPDGARRVQQAELHISARLASVPRWIGLPEGSWLETDANDEIDAALSGGTRTRGGVVHWLESKAAIAAAATLLVVAITVAALHFGLPRLAQRVAAAVPADIDQKLGQTTLASLHAIGASPSQLSSAQRENVQRQLARIVRDEPMPD